MAIAVAGAVAIGWSHLAGRCGLSHFGALTPQGSIAGYRSEWFVNVLVYVAAGALSSAAVGAALGLAGHLAASLGFREALLAVALIVAFAAALSDLRLTRWRLPQPNRQTRREWGLMFRRPVPAALWGAGLGLTFATVFTFAGTWLVLGVPFAVGEPAFGAILLVAHWLGRASPILIGPLLLRNAGQTPELLCEIERLRNIFRASSIFGIMLMALSLIVLLAPVP